MPIGRQGTRVPFATEPEPLGVRAAALAPQTGQAVAPGPRDLRAAERFGISAPGVGRVLAVMLGSVTFAALAVVLVGVATGGKKHIAFGLAAMIVNGALFTLARRGRYEKAVALAGALSILVIVTVLTVIGNGLHDVSIVLFQMPVLVASLTLSRRGMVAVATLVVLAVMGVGFAEISGVLATRMSWATSYDDIAVVAVIVIASAIMTRTVVVAMHQGFRAARASEESYREIFDGTGEAIFIHDARDGRIVDVNRMCSAMFGYGRDELIGMRLSALSAPESPADEAELRARLSDANRDGYATFEWRARAKDGRLFYVESNLRSTQIGGEGRVLSAVRDIDDRRRLEESLAQAEKLQAVGQLAGGVAHDFNNQLTGIIAGAELLKRRVGEDPLAAEYADIILQASRRSADLVGNLLAFARKAKRQEVDVDVCGVVEEVVGLLERSIDRRIQIEVELPSTVVRVKGDPTLLSNALLNLGLNARDAMPGGGTLRFHVELARRERLGSLGADFAGASHVAAIRVSDTGHGMDEATEQRIFEPFFTTKATGTGMGLAAVYGTVKSHGGTVTVQTRPGDGTSFLLLLPAAVPTSVGRAPSSGPAVSGAQLDVLVLLAEDEPTVASATRAMLEAIGCRVLLARNGREAVDLFRATDDVDVVLLDQMMPEITGDRALREIRALDAEIPAIIASGYADRATEPPCPGGRGVVTLRKPYVLAALEQAVREALCSGGAPTGELPANQAG